VTLFQQMSNKVVSKLVRVFI